MTGEELAREFESANARFVELVRGLADEQWVATGANAPGYRFDDLVDEARTIAQIASHVANQHLIQMEIARGVVRRSMAAEPGYASAQANAQEVVMNPSPDRDEVVARLEAHGAVVAEFLLSLTAEQLGRSMTFKGWTMTVEQLVDQGVIGHIRWHTLSIEEALN